MLFFGISNFGLGQNQLLAIVQDGPNQALIESLVVDHDSEPSEYLRRISDEFSKDFEGKYVIVTIFERSYSPTLEVRYQSSAGKGSSSADIS